MTIIIAIIAFWIVWAIIATIVERHRQGIRDSAAHEALDGTYDYEREKTEILAINREFDFVRKEQICPACGGYLVLRSSVSGFFFGCGNFPKCRYTRQAN